MEQVMNILHFMLKSLAHIWPYLVFTIPVAVSVKFFGLSGLIRKAVNQDPYVAILLATIVGAVSPLCSCGVVPVVASLLIGGVPLAPIMSFWIASPSMDPEVFLLSVAAVGWKLSVWRLAATFIISLSSGIITHLVFNRSQYGADILRPKSSSCTWMPVNQRIRNTLNRIKDSISLVLPEERKDINIMGLNVSKQYGETMNCCVSIPVLPADLPTEDPATGHSCPKRDPLTCSEKLSLRKFLHETWKAVLLVTKFMLLAFFISALIEFYLPKDLLANIFSGPSIFSPLVASLVGIPFYTTNVTALPMVSGLIDLGMDPGTALAFLIAGPVTTLPAMMAVWGIVRPKIFFMYLGFSLSGAIISGYLYNLVY